MRDGVVAPRSLALCALCALTAAVAGAQAVPKLTLKPADARLDAEFTNVTGLRELRDGRVLLTDQRENRLVVADLKAGTVEPVGRTGAGPGEYRFASRLWAMGADSTLMPTEGYGPRWIVLGGAKPAVTQAASDSPFGLGMQMVMGGDARGRVIAAVMVLSAARGGTPGDSLALLLADRAGHRTDTIARLRSPYGGPIVSAAGGRAVERMAGNSPGGTSPLGLFLMDQAVMFGDGWVAIARQNPYRVDWRSPTGALTAGAPLGAGGKITPEDRKAHLERENRLTGRPVRDAERVTGWPETMPPFEGTHASLFASPDGRVLILRSASAATSGMRYDVVDRRGALAAVLTMPDNERIVGFGAKSVYVVVTDNDGIQRLRRHPWP
jgi:hypothetical protein